MRYLLIIAALAALVLGGCAPLPPLETGSQSTAAPTGVLTGVSTGVPTSAPTDVATTVPTAEPTGPATVAPTTPTAVGTATPAATPGSTDNAYTSLIDALIAVGVRSQPFAVLTDTFFGVPAQVLKVGAEDLQIYVFPDVAAAEAAAALVGPDGTKIGTSAVRWIAPPHFYRLGRVIALYLGADAQIQAGLTQVMGPQFAGQ